MVVIKNDLKEQDVSSEEFIVLNPYNRECLASLKYASTQELRKEINDSYNYKPTLSRKDRHVILTEARHKLLGRKEEFSKLITSESGLCLNDSIHEVKRACDVLFHAANTVYHEYGGVIPTDASGNSESRIIYTKREPLKGVIAAITPFNHPLNQVIHKVAPAIASNNRIIVKPSEKTPLTALALTELLYEAGLPEQMLKLVLAPAKSFTKEVCENDKVDLITFTGSTEVGKSITKQLGYKRTILELGGNDPLVVCADADIILAAKLAAAGAFANSGQRCTAVKRILVDRTVKDEFIKKLIEETQYFVSGDPMDLSTTIGTVIDENSANNIVSRVQKSVEMGAKCLTNLELNGALLSPIILDEVTPDMPVVKEETFGPVAPILVFDTLDEAINIINQSEYGLSSSIITKNIDNISLFVCNLEVGTVNFNEVPGFRSEASPFGGIKSSGLGFKEGVVEAFKCYTNVKTYSLPWQGIY